LTHVYSSSVEPGVNAYTIPGYANSDPTAIYDGSGGANSDIALYPNLGEDGADIGPGAPAAIVVHAWNGVGNNTDWNINAFIGGVLIAVDSTPPVDILDISTTYGITYPNINAGQTQTLYWDFTGGGGTYDVWFDRDNDTPGNPGLTFGADVQATVSNTQQNNGTVGSPAWAAFNGTWTAGKHYRTTITFTTPAAVNIPVGRIEDLGGGPIQYDYQAFPAFQVLAPIIIDENFEAGNLNNWSATNYMPAGGPSGKYYINRTAGSYPVHSGTRAAGFSDQGSYTQYFGGTWWAQLELSGGGRVVGATGTYRTGFWADGYNEGYFDYFGWYVLRNGVTIYSYTNSYFGPYYSMSYYSTDQAFTAGQTIQVRFYNSGDYYVYAGAQIDDVKIEKL
jgi:hypothetical protein